MLDDAEHAAQLQGLEHRGERRALEVARHPVVQVAEGHHQVRGAGRADVPAARTERGHDGIAVEIGPCRELGRIARERIGAGDFAGFSSTCAA
ncbi:MAG: hypothetical protein U1F11_04800 [Steroidobacteraceae bacterium]